MLSKVNTRSSSATLLLSKQHHRAGSLPVNGPHGYHCRSNWMEHKAANRAALSGWWESILRNSARLGMLPPHLTAIIGSVC